MDVQDRRMAQARTVDESYAALSSLLHGTFTQGCFNKPEVLAAERRGLSVCDGMLGHVLQAERDPQIAAKASRLLNAVRDGIVPAEVESRCHNLHSAVMLMLDRIGCPSVVVWGSVNASAPGTVGFVLNAAVGLRGPNHRPGHSWLLSPYWAVADLALKHQFAAGVGDDYAVLRPRIPSLIVSESTELSEPEPKWWRIPGRPGIVEPPVEVYANESKYQDVLGWTKVELESLTVRYLPGAVAIPEEDDINAVEVVIGGMRPGDFFASILDTLLS